jgi:hypothetical protein
MAGGAFPCLADVDDDDEHAVRNAATRRQPKRIEIRIEIL